MNRQKRWQLANPQKRKAHNKLHSALRSGLIERQPCVECGKPQTDGHHENYNEPLAITWLCRRHHMAAHRKAASK